MNTLPRRAVLALTAALGLFVGAWAEFLPASFFAGFPGFGLHWVRASGPYDVHLVSDTGSAYLAFAAISVAGLISARAIAGRLAGLVWTVFGVFHIAFHTAHPAGRDLDQAGEIVSLAVSALLGVGLIVLPAGPIREGVR